MKSSWRSPNGGSSVAPNTKIEPSEAVFCPWWGTGSTPIRSFHTVSSRHSGDAISTVPHSPKLRHIGQTLNARGFAYAPAAVPWNHL
jgi:hypothetical protein